MELAQSRQLSAEQDWRPVLVQGMTWWLAWRRAVVALGAERGLAACPGCVSRAAMHNLCCQVSWKAPGTSCHGAGLSWFCAAKRGPDGAPAQAAPCCMARSNCHGPPYTLAGVHVPATCSSACSLRPSAAALHALTVTWSRMHGLSMAAGHGDISTLDLSCLPAAGAHNTANAATAALLAASLGVGVSPASLQRTIPLLRLPPHRCALVLSSCHACRPWLEQQAGLHWRAMAWSGPTKAPQGTMAAWASFALAAASQQAMCSLATHDQVLFECAAPPADCSPWASVRVSTSWTTLQAALLSPPLPVRSPLWVAPRLPSTRVHQSRVASELPPHANLHHLPACGHPCR